MSAPVQSRPVKLQYNCSGAWRNLLDFDRADEVRVMAAAEELFSGDTKTTLRVIIPGHTAPLVSWKHDTGWKKWMR